MQIVDQLLSQSFGKGEKWPQLEIQEGLLLHRARNGLNLKSKRVCCCTGQNVCVSLSLFVN